MKKNLNIKELFVDENIGIDCISLVEYPAIEIDFQYFNDNVLQNVTFARLNKDKHILTGPALIPNKNIYRYNAETNEEYYVFFSTETVEKISQLYLMKSKQSNVNLEHMLPLEDISIVESWIVTDEVNDKAVSLGYQVPVGTWMISMKVNNEQVWDEFVKKELVKGFSIEGYFAEKFSEDKTKEDILFDKIKEIIASIEE